MHLFLSFGPLGIMLQFLSFGPSGIMHQFLSFCPLGIIRQFLSFGPSDSMCQLLSFCPGGFEIYNIPKRWRHSDVGCTYRTRDIFLWDVLSVEVSSHYVLRCGTLCICTKVTAKKSELANLLYNSKSIEASLPGVKKLLLTTDSSSSSSMTKIIISI
jgi:hypothetical protein